MAAVAPVAEPASKDVVLGLTAWLNELRLGSYLEAASNWAEEQGAISLSEIIENLDDFADDMKMKPVERKRLTEKAEAAAESAVAAAKAAAAAAPAAPVAARRSAAPAGPEEADDAVGTDDLNEGRSALLHTQDDLAEMSRCNSEAPAREAAAAAAPDSGSDRGDNGRGKGGGKAPAALERRVDPEDGQARSLDELRALYAGQYSAQEIDEYWQSCEPVVDGRAAGSGGYNAAAAPPPGLNGRIISGGAKAAPAPQGAASQALTSQHWGAGRSKMRF